MIGMIKGVNKRIVEISFPESVYFEKAVVFLKADCSAKENPCIANEAGAMILELERGICGNDNERRKMKGKMRLVRLAELVFRLSVVICAGAIICMLAVR